jgi:hypothetical protein
MYFLVSVLLLPIKRYMHFLVSVLLLPIKRHKRVMVAKNQNKLQRGIFGWKNALPYYKRIVCTSTIYPKTLDFWYNLSTAALKFY